jgi:hypothetical protein
MRISSFDWSGARNHAARLRNIACFEGMPGGTPNLRRPANAINWSRFDVVDFLAAMAVDAACREAYEIVGMDFPFSFPWTAGGNYFPTGQCNRCALWEHIHEIVWNDEAGNAQNFVNNHAELFAQNGNVGIAYVNHQRATEVVAYQAGHRALGVYNLRGVSPGKAAICGIAVLQELTLRCRSKRTPLLVWPFFRLDEGEMIALDLSQPLKGAPKGCLVVVETYPRVFWNNCQQQLDLHNNPATWDAVRCHFHNNSPNPTMLPCNTDQADALVAWYGMSAPKNVANPLAPSQSMIDAEQEKPGAIQQEGWIIGI